MKDEETLHEFYLLYHELRKTQSELDELRINFLVANMCFGFVALFLLGLIIWFA